MSEGLSLGIVLLGGVVNVAGCIGYILDTARGKVRPSRVSWGVWTVTAAIATAAQFSMGVRLGAILTFMLALIPASVVVATFVPRWRGIRPSLEIAPTYQQVVDSVCLTSSMLTLVAWYLTDNATVALVLIIMVDGIAGIPTILRAWQGSEQAGPFLSCGFSAVCTLIALPVITFADGGYALYVVGLCTIVSGLVFFRRSVPRHRVPALAVVPEQQSRMRFPSMADVSLEDRVRRMELLTQLMLAGRSAEDTALQARAALSAHDESRRFYDRLYSEALTVGWSVGELSRYGCLASFGFSAGDLVEVESPALAGLGVAYGDVLARCPHQRHVCGVPDLGKGAQSAADIQHANGVRVSVGGS